MSSAGSAALQNREAKENAMVGGFLVPKGTQIMFNPFAAHFDPQQYADPQEFRWAAHLAT